MAKKSNIMYMYFKHVNLIIITHACADFSGVLFAIISTNSCTYLY